MEDLPSLLRPSPWRGADGNSGGAATDVVLVLGRANPRTETSTVFGELGDPTLAFGEGKCGLHRSTFRPEHYVRRPTIDCDAVCHGVSNVP